MTRARALPLGLPAAALLAAFLLPGCAVLDAARHVLTVSPRFETPAPRYEPRRCRADPQELLCP